jgi:hypothetical protein
MDEERNEEETIGVGDVEDDIPPISTDEDGEVVEPLESENPFDHGFGEADELM